MISDDLRHPRINIFHTSERKQDAQALLAKYTNLGARVTLLEVDDDLSTRKHSGKLYYFDDSPRFKEIANSLAKDLRGIEQVSPHYLQLSQSQQPNYAIWIVKSHKIQTNQVLVIVPNPIETESLTQKETVILETTEIYMVQCPQCPSPVRNDRLAKHLLNVHSGKQPTSATPKEKKSSTSKPPSVKSCVSFGHYEVSPQPTLRDNRFWVRSSGLPSSLGKYRCRHCGGVAIFDTDVCYTCNPK